MENACPTRPLIWHSAERTLIARGVAAQIELTGPGRFDEAQAWFDEVTRAADITDEVARPGTGLLAFGSFAFFDVTPTTSRLIIPTTVWGEDEDGCWRTDIAPADPDASSILPSAAERALPLEDSPRRDLPTELKAVEEIAGLAGDSYLRAVEEMRGRLRAGEAHKAVLARDLVFRCEREIDERLLATRLASAFPDCWTFAVDGLVGATPEMLASVRRGKLSSRVLAGSWPVAGDREAATQALLGSVKDRHEHDYALASVHEAITPRASDAWVSERFALQLPHVIHLATDITATLTEGNTGLTVAGAMHPTAAVGGSPQRAALAIIGEAEPTDRGRYAAPVGWMDGDGNADWALALRCAEITGCEARAFAGGGIMADSDPARELAETEAKFSAIREALS